MLSLVMGEITIKVPQRIHRSFQIDSRKSAEEILADLERRAISSINQPSKRTKLSGISRLMKKYRDNPNEETIDSIRLAEEWRERWNR